MSGGGGGKQRSRLSLLLIAATLLFMLSSQDALAAKSHCPDLSKDKAWSVTECWIYAQSINGDEADLHGYDFAAHIYDTLHPNDEIDWYEIRLVSSEFLRSILFEKNYSKEIQRKGVRIVEALFREKADLSDGHIPFPLWLHKSHFEKGIDLSDFISEKSLSFEGSQVTGSFVAHRLQAKGGLYMGYGAHFTSIDLGGAHIGMQLVMTGATVSDKFTMNSLQVDNSLHMNSKGKDRANFEEIDLRSAHIGGMLNMAGAKVNGKLNMDKLTVDSSLSMVPTKDYQAELTEIDLCSAHIGGQLAMVGAKVDGNINMSGLHVEKGLFLISHGNHELQINGNVRLSGGEVGHLDLLDIKVGDKVEKIDFSGTNIKRELRLQAPESETRPEKSKNKWGGARFILKNVTCDALQDHDSNAWPEGDGTIDLTGLKYTLLGGLHGEDEGSLAERPKDRILDLLDRRYMGKSPQPYQQLASILSAEGREAKARAVGYALMVKLRKQENYGFHWAWMWLQQIFIGYGYRNMLALLWIGVMVIVGTVWLHATGEAERLGMPSGIAYSLDMLLPIVKLRSLHYSKEFDLVNHWARWYFYFHQLMGWALALFLAAGLSGLTKR